jgi:hypothetical protein
MTSIIALFRNDDGKIKWRERTGRKFKHTPTTT